MIVRHEIVRLSLAAFCAVYAGRGWENREKLGWELSYRRHVRKVWDQSHAERHLVLPSAIHIASMAHMDNGDGLLHIVNVIQHPIIPDPQTPSFATGQLSRALWTRLVSQCKNGFSKSVIGVV